MKDIMTCTQAGGTSVYAWGLLIVWVTIWYFGVRDGSIVGDTTDLIVSRKGTINWCTIVTLGYRIIYTLHLTWAFPPRLVGTLPQKYLYIYIYIISPPDGAPYIVTSVFAIQPVPDSPRLKSKAIRQTPVYLVDQSLGV